MHPDQTALSNGKPGAKRRRAGVRSELDDLRATCRRQAVMIESLRDAAVTLTLRLEAEDPGRGGVIAPRAPDVRTGSGFGLKLETGGSAAGTRRDLRDVGVSLLPLSAPVDERPCVEPER